jgi:hypothetical protein
MQAYNNAYSLLTPKELHQRAFIGTFAINTILLVSLISTMGYWYVLGLEASTATGIWAVITFSIIGLGLITEFVKKITLSLFRHKAIWLSATVISVLTIAGTLSIIDSNKETGLIRSSSGYQLAQSRQENALNNATQYAWASAFNLNQLQNDLVALTAKRERRAIRYQAYLTEKRAISEKIAAKRNYDSELAMQTMAGKIIANGSSLQTSSNPLLYGVASATGAGVSFLKLAFYLAVTLLLEFSAWFLGGEVEKIKNQLRFDSKQLLELQNIETFGMAFSEVLRPALNAPETVPAETDRGAPKQGKLTQSAPKQVQTKSAPQIDIASSGTGSKRGKETADTGITGANAQRYNAVKEAIKKGGLKGTYRGIKAFKFGGRGIGDSTVKHYMEALRKEGVIA